MKDRYRTSWVYQVSFDSYPSPDPSHDILALTVRFTRNPNNHHRTLRPKRLLSFTFHGAIAGAVAGTIAGTIAGASCRDNADPIFCLRYTVLLVFVRCFRKNPAKIAAIYFWEQSIVTPHCSSKTSLINNFRNNRRNYRLPPFLFFETIKVARTIISTLFVFNACFRQTFPEQLPEKSPKQLPGQSSPYCLSNAQLLVVRSFSKTVLCQFFLRRLRVE